MVDHYSNVILAASVLSAAITSARMAFLMARRWDFENCAIGWFCVFAAVAAAFIQGFITDAATTYGGYPLGLVTVGTSLPMVGLIWLFVVGGNKVLERILGRLIEKLS